MLYRFAHAVNASYGLTVAWAYVLSFLLALCLLFVFPQITLLLFFLGLASLSLTVGLGWAIGGVTRGMARHALNAGRCPRCGAPMQQAREPGMPWTCEHCCSEFLAAGDEVQPLEREHWVEDSDDSAGASSRRAPDAFADVIAFAQETRPD